MPDTESTHLDDLNARYREAVALHKSGRLNEARSVYESLLDLLPNHPALLHMLGVLVHSQGDPQRAVALIERALAVRPNAASYHNNLANALRDQGRLADARDAYRRALALRPDYPQALQNLELLMGSSQAYTVLEADLRDLLTRKPREAEAQLALAQLQSRTGRPGETEASLRRVLVLDPRHAGALLDLGNLLRSLGRLDDAIACFRRLQSVDPGSSAAYNNLGALFQLRGEIAAGRACLMKALELAPDSIDAHYNLARLLDETDDLDVAHAHYEKALRPGSSLQIEILCHLALLERRRGNFGAAEARRSQVFAAVDGWTAATANRSLPPLTLNLLAAPAPLRRAVATHQASLLERATAEARSRCAFVHPSGSPERLRIGYVSPDFRQHAVGSLISGLFEAHDRSRFEVFAYSLVQVDDAFSERIRAGCDHFHDASRESPEATARRIHADGIHILIDLAGYTTYSRTEIFALRPAPVQAHYLGYLDTMGAPFLPYLIADATTVPDALSHNFSEAIVRLPNSFAVAAWLPVGDTTPARADCGLPEDGFVFCCLNGLQKLDLASFDRWMRILARVPNSLLWLFEGTADAGIQRLRAEAERRGVAGQRLRFAPRLPLPEYLARYRVADLFLDSFDYNAGATGLGALAAGLPVLTCQGESFLSRMGASFCHAAGLPELICASPEAFEERAVELAMDPDQLGGLRDRLVTARRDAPLFDGPGYVRGLERAYWLMWQQHETGVAPRSLSIAVEA